MSIETTCTGCGKTLRVADEFAGRQARCPVCNNIYTVPGVATTSPASSSAADDEIGGGRWYMKTPEGQTYGPVDKSELDRWVAEGRVTADCEVRENESLQWQAADQAFPALRPVTHIAAGGDASYATSSSYSGYRGGGTPGAATAYSSAGAAQSSFTSSSHLVPHRGGLILVLGILGFVVTCPILSIMAWVMGSQDLHEMRAGRMDPGGMGLTQAGQILGMIYSVIAIIGAVLTAFIILIAAAAG